MLDRITFLIFKDEHPAKTLQISLKWLIAFGVLVVLGWIGVTLSIILGSQFFAETPVIQKITPAITTSKPNPKMELATKELELSPLAFQLIPKPIEKSPSFQPPGIELKNISYEWNQGTLDFQFIIKKNKFNGASQKGRFSIIAYNDQQMFFYPNNAISGNKTKSILTLNHGEFFSVKNFRNVKTSFKTLENNSIKFIEVLIFNLKNQLLFRQTLPISDGNKK